MALKQMALNISGKESFVGQIYKACENIKYFKFMLMHCVSHNKYFEKIGIYHMLWISSIIGKCIHFQGYNHHQLHQFFSEIEDKSTDLWHSGSVA